MSYLFYLSHPEVVVDPETEITEWELSEVGRQRTMALVSAACLHRASRIYCSTEAKAIQTASILGQGLGLDVAARPDLGENDRSATGFVPPNRFEELATAFFSSPNESILGWERAIDAQRRIVAEIMELTKSAKDGSDIIVVGHGGVGTLLYCHLARVPIDRCHDQPSQGHYFTSEIRGAKQTQFDDAKSFDSSDPVVGRSRHGQLRVLHRWQRFETAPSFAHLRQDSSRSKLDEE